MSQMRFNPVTRDWVILAEERGDRPHDFQHGGGAARPTDRHRRDCPFCPGNEDPAVEEIARRADEEGGWRVRVIPNKFPALRPDENIERKSEGMFLWMEAAGHHEVVIDHPRHDAQPATIGREHLAELLGVYRERYAALRSLDYVRHITVFRNHGVRGGASLEHPHSQIVAAPIVPPQVRLRMQDARRFREEVGRCLFCEVLADERKSGERMVEDCGTFAGFVPFGALTPYHQWIFPERHTASFDAITDAEIEDLATVLSRMLVRLREGVGDPDFNLSIRSAPTEEAEVPHYHWYVAIVPRISRIAGFEMGSGIFTNPVSPERAAERMRSVALPE